jgi:aldose 1-epimerase
MPIVRSIFGTTPDGVAVERYSLSNSHGLQADIMTYGATLLAVRAPDRAGTPGDVVLGFDGLEGYLADQPYLGAVCGRVANRIAGGRFELNGETYTLAINNDPNHLHGGPGGFHRQVWAARERDSADGPSVELSYLSPDGQEGYPGNLSVVVAYTLTERGELRIEYTATTDRDTVVNLTNHAYFNLAGGGDILDHQVEIAASRFVPIGANLIPLGELRPVRGTPFDFTTPARVGAHVDADDEQIRNGLGYDHTWVLDKADGALGFAARVYAPATGRVLEVSTTEPGLQFYTGNFLDGSLTGRGGQIYAYRTGLCLETQHFPDSPNQPQFPSVVLRPGQTYTQTTIYHFGVRE